MTKDTTTSYILHTRPFKETSLIVNLFSQEHGLFSLVAKGIKRKSFQAQKAILQPFNLLTLEYAGRGELKTLCEVELAEPQFRLPNRALACGYYLNELLLRSLQEWQECGALFDCYHKTICALQSSLEYSIILRNFELVLLDELGVAPQWHYDISGNNISRECSYRFIPEQGFELIDENRDMHYNESQSGSFSGEAILSLGDQNYTPQMSKMCQRITQLLLRQVIGNKPLESRKLWL